MVTILWLLFLPRTHLTYPHPLTNRPVSQSCVLGTTLQSGLVPRGFRRRRREGKDPGISWSRGFQTSEKVECNNSILLVVKRIQSPISTAKAFSPNVTVMVLTATVPPYLLKRLQEIYHTHIFWVWSADARVISRPLSPRRRKALGTRLLVRKQGLASLAGQSILKTWRIVRFLRPTLDSFILSPVFKILWPACEVRPCIQLE